MPDPGPRPIGTYRPPGPGSSYRPPSEDRRAAKRFYCSAAWRKLRALFLADEPLCRDCEATGRTTPAAEAHHVRGRRERPDLALDPDNLMGLCKPCHSKRTNRGE